MKALIFDSVSSCLKFVLFEREGKRLLVDGDVDWTIEPVWVERVVGGHRFQERFAEKGRLVGRKMPV